MPPVTSQTNGSVRKRGSWSPEEDKRLLELVSKQKAIKWVEIAERLGTRTSKQCRERYHQKLKPSLSHTPITPEEGKQIERLVGIYGKRWAEIARHLKGRSDNVIKNWWNASTNRRRIQPHIGVAPHQQAIGSIPEYRTDPYYNFREVAPDAFGPQEAQLAFSQNLHQYPQPAPNHHYLPNHNIASPGPMLRPYTIAGQPSSSLGPHTQSEQPVGGILGQAGAASGPGAAPGSHVLGDQIHGFGHARRYSYNPAMSVPIPVPIPVTGNLVAAAPTVGPLSTSAPASLARDRSAMPPYPSHANNAPVDVASPPPSSAVTFNPAYMEPPSSIKSGGGVKPGESDGQGSSPPGYVSKSQIASLGFQSPTGSSTHLPGSEPYKKPPAPLEPALSPESTDSLHHGAPRSRFNSENLVPRGPISSLGKLGALGQLGSIPPVNTMNSIDSVMGGDLFSLSRYSLNQQRNPATSPPDIGSAPSSAGGSVSSPTLTASLPSGVLNNHANASSDFLIEGPNIQVGQGPTTSSTSLTANVPSHPGSLSGSSVSSAASSARPSDASSAAMSTGSLGSSIQPPVQSPASPILPPLVPSKSHMSEPHGINSTAPLGSPGVPEPSLPGPSSPSSAFAANVAVLETKSGDTEQHYEESRPSPKSDGVSAVLPSIQIISPEQALSGIEK